MFEGKTIAITRSEQDSGEFVQLMAKANAKALPLSTIELVSKGEKIVEQFLDEIKNYDPDYSVFMSSKAVNLLFENAKIISKYQNLQIAVANTIVVAVGPKTKESLENQGIRVSYMPDRYSSVGIGEVFTSLNAVGKKVIVPRSGVATSFLKDLLEKIGLNIKEIYLYDVRVVKNDSPSWQDFRNLFSEQKMDGIIFTSASSVRAFFEIMSKHYDDKTLLKNLENTKVVAIGPFTADELKKFHVGNTISEVHTVPGAFETIKSIFA